MKTIKKSTPMDSDAPAAANCEKRRVDCLMMRCMDATPSLYSETGEAIHWADMIYVEDDRKANRLSGRRRLSLVT